MEHIINNGTAILQMIYSILTKNVILENSNIHEYVWFTITKKQAIIFKRLIFKYNLGLFINNPLLQ